MGVRSLPPQPASAASSDRSLGMAEKPTNSGLLRTRERSPDSCFPVFGGQTTESLRPTLRVFPFYGDYRWRLGSSATAARGPQCHVGYLRNRAYVATLGRLRANRRHQRGPQLLADCVERLAPSGHSLQCRNQPMIPRIAPWHRCQPYCDRCCINAVGQQLVR